MGWVGMGWDDEEVRGADEYNSKFIRSNSM